MGQAYRCGSQADPLDARGNLKLCVRRRGDQRAQRYIRGDAEGYPDQADQQQDPLNVPRPAVNFTLQRGHFDALLDCRQALLVDQCSSLVAQPLAKSQIGNDGNYH